MVGILCKIKDNAPDVFEYLFKDTPNYIKNTRKSSGGYGGAEAHASYTYCSLAALKLLDIEETDDVTFYWLLNK